MTLTTLFRLARAGSRTDTLRVGLTAVSAALATVALLGAATVLSIPGGSPENGTADQYRNQLLVQPGLRPGLAFALVLLTIPVLALAGQCARLGAPARDRRLAGFRLAGATPGQVMAISAAETGTASLLGAGFGLAVYLVGRKVAGHPDPDGRLALPTDVRPASWAVAAICLGIPLLAAVASVLHLRRVIVTPFGVVRRLRRDRPTRPWPAVQIGLGVLAFASVGNVSDLARRHPGPGSSFAVPMLLFVGGLLVSRGVVRSAGWLSYLAGRVLHRLARGPAALLAARRLTADPWASSRTFAVLLVAVTFGAGAAGVRAWLATDFAVRDDVGRWEAARTGTEFHPSDGRFYYDTLNLVNVAVSVAMVIAAGGLLVALAESIVARRRTYASLVAAGVPRATLARSILWQGLAPAVPQILVALGVGVVLVRGVAGESRAGGYYESLCVAGDICARPDPPVTAFSPVHVPEFIRTMPIPLTEIALVGAGAISAVLVTVWVGLLFLRASTAVEELRVA